MIRLLISSLLILMSSDPIQAKSQESGFLSWQRILHAQEGMSSIESPEFFISPRGMRDPRAEWEALIRADERQQSDWACRFPARILVFERISGRSWPAAPCTEYLAWKKRLNFRSLSLVYSTAYAGNPASALGHNILKFNLQDGAEDEQESGLPLLDYGFGFLAKSDPNDGGMVYIFKGLFGAYPGFFVLQPYYELVNTYAYAENRDLWEVELSLSHEEKDLFLAHVWELIHQASTPYYFTHVNCSTMILEVLDAVKPDWDLRSQFKGLILPQAVMQKVAAVGANGRDYFWPSQKRIFGERWRLLNADQRKKFLDWRDHAKLAAAADDAAVLDTIIEQLNLKKSKITLDQQEALRADEDRVLLARSHLPASSLQLPGRASAGNNPLAAHGLHKLTLLAGTEDAGLRLRHGLHDLLDAPQGFNSYYHTNFFDLSLMRRHTDKKIGYDFRVIDLWSINPHERINPAGTWAVTFGIDDQGLHLRGAFGASLELRADRSLVYGMPDLDVTREGQSAGVRLGWFHSWTFGWRQLLEFHPAYALDSQAIRWDWMWEQRWSLNRHWQLEARISYEDQVQARLGIGQYF